MSLPSGSKEILEKVLGKRIRLEDGREVRITIKDRQLLMDEFRKKLNEEGVKYKNFTFDDLKRLLN